MKVKYENGIYTIYINLYYENKIDFKNKDELENYFRKLFVKLKKYYDIELTGYYNIHVYYNEFFGAILTIEKEELEYYDYFDDKLDMRISVENNQEFLYQLDDVRNDLKTKFPIYQYMDHLYLKVGTKLSSTEMGELLEYSTIIYDDETENVLTFGKIIPSSIF